MTNKPEASDAVRPGALSALLEDIARQVAREPASGSGPELRPGAVIDRFEIVQEVGRGGFGIVYEARDQQLARTVAFKVVRPGSKPEVREQRLLQEAETAARLSHPNIVTLFEVGRCEQGPFLVLEMLRGQTLGQRLAQGRLSLKEALRIGVDVAKGLAHAHSKGVVHRDLTPGNVYLCDDGQVKVLDLGMAHAFGRRKLDGGTPAYMAPEQQAGAPEDERTDAFALGVILYEMLAGERPFEDERALASSRPAAALEVPGQPGLGELVARMLLKEPVKRPRDAGEVLAALQAFEQEVGRSSTIGHAKVQRRRGARMSMVLLVGLSLLVGASIARLVSTSPKGSSNSLNRPLVAVADFENRTDDSDLDGLSGLLITALEQSHRLKVLTRTRLVDLLRQSGKDKVERIDESLGREASLRAGASLVLATVRRFEDVYAIDVKVLDPAKGEYLLTAKEEGRGKAAVPGLIDRVCDRVRREMQEQTEDLAKPHVGIADAVINLQAYQHYSRGKRLVDPGLQFDEAVAEFRKAIAIDPGLAMAHYELARAYEFAGTWSFEEQQEEIEAALAGINRLPEKERLLVQALKAHVDDRDAAANDLYARAAALFPQDKEVVLAAGDLLFNQGDVGSALEYVEKAFGLDPTWDPAAVDLAYCYLLTNRASEAVAIMRGLLRGAPTEYSGAYRLVLAKALIAQGRPDEGIAALASDGVTPGHDLLGTGRPTDRLRLARIYLNAGRPRQAEVEAKLAYVGTNRHDPTYSYYYALPLAFQGRAREALSVLPRERPYWKAVVIAGMGSTAATRRAVDQALSSESSAGQLAADRAQRREFRRLAPILLESVGEYERAADIARQASPGPAKRLYEALVEWRAKRNLLPLKAMANQAGWSGASYFLGRALLEAGEFKDSAERLRRFKNGYWGATTPSRFPEEVDLFDALVYPRSYVLLARAQEREGDAAGAATTIDAFLAMWSKADTDLPLLAEAKALKKRLAGGFQMAPTERR
jgi:serine/threonine protein kinase/Flp pilus assembly protein TadD